MAALCDVNFLLGIFVHIYSSAILSLTPRFNEGSEAFRTPLENRLNGFFAPGIPPEDKPLKRFVHSESHLAPN